MPVDDTFGLLAGPDQPTGVIVQPNRTQRPLATMLMQVKQSALRARLWRNLTFVDRTRDPAPV